MTTSFDFPHFVDMLEANARRYGDKDAVLFLDDGKNVGATASFAQLHDRARTLAAVLQERYPDAGRVLLMLPTGMDYVHAFCGCLAAGMIAVPLFPPQSRKPRHLDRVRNVVSDADPCLILCEAPVKPMLQELAGNMRIAADILTLDELQASTTANSANLASAWRRPPPDGDTVAFLQYTSGSTGTPKGVMVRHRNLLANLELMRRAYNFDDRDRMVNWLPLYHDMGLIGGLLEPIYSGMNCYLMASQSFVKAPTLWLQALSRYRGTASFAPNFAYALCNRTVDDATVAQLDLSAWRHAINGAEPIHPGTLDEFRKRFAPAGFRPEAASPGYGQAEATLCVSATPHDALPVTVRVDKKALQAGRVMLASSDADAVKFVACGSPQPGHRVAIVNPQTLTHCAPDEVGEIWLSGPSNADAYWQKPEASEQTFHARAAGDDDGARYLRSGDLGFLHQGQVVVCGRLKDVIIMNGRNLYPNDIEFAITDAEPGIRAGRIAAFSIADTALGREKLVVVAEPHRKFVDPAHHAKLFAGMRQAAHEAADCAIDLIVLIQAGTIPMTTSGKISRNGAKQQWLDNALDVIAISGAVETTDALDNALIGADELRSRICHIDHVGDEDGHTLCLDYLRQQVRRLQPGAPCDAGASLIALGLDSIAISTLHSRLQNDLGFSPALDRLFGNGTLEELAAALRRYLAQPAADACPAIAAVPGRTVARQSFAQRRLWFLHQLEPGNCRHNIAIAIGLRGPLDSAALRRSLQTVASRHAVLRTRYLDGTQGAEQIVEPEATPAFDEIDLSTLPDDMQRREIERQLHDERHTPFDLHRGSVLRARLIRRSLDTHTLVLGLHHIAFDGRSAEILLDELGCCLAAFSGQREPDLSALPVPLSVQYADFAEWESGRITPAFADAELAFWRAYLKDLPHAIALAPVLAAVDSPAAAQQRFHLRHAQVEHIARFCRDRHLTLFMGLLTLFGVIIHHWSGQTRFIVGTDVAGRMHPQLDGLIGFFVNQLPIRCDLGGDPSLLALFERIGADAQQAYAHQELPFDMLVSALAPARSSERTPLFQIKLNYQPERASARDLAFGAAAVEHIAVEQDIAGFALVLDLVHDGEGIAAVWKYNTRIVDTHTVARLQHLWEKLMTTFDSLLDQPISAVCCQLQDWDTALQREAQQAQVMHSRAQLGAVKRRIANV